jgi:membrane protease YdiL (CAAX protease family)
MNMVSWPVIHLRARLAWARFCRASTKTFSLDDLRFDWKVVVITVISTLLLIVERYHVITSWKPFDRTLLFLVVPLIVIVLVFRENPRNYGFQLGDWKAGLVITITVLVIILPVLWLVMRGNQMMRTYYQPLINPIIPVYTFFDLLGWEFLFRGWLTFAYVRKFGVEGLWLQAVPFAIAHIPKPEIETLSTIFGGFAFGLIAWRTKSFLYPFIIHWAIFTFVVINSGGSLG